MLTVKNLTKRFDDLEVLRFITHTFLEGKTTVILGSSGSGKSTLLRCLNHLEIPTSGQVLFQGEVLNEKNIIKARRQIGMVFQQFNLFRYKTVEENITYALKVHKIGTEESRREIADALLRRVGLSDKKHSYPAKLSGGQKQRVALARSLALKPTVFLFDEPTSALDPEMVKEVLDVMRDIAKQKITNIIVTHEVAFAREIADEVLFMHEGQIKEVSKAQAFFKAPKTKEAQNYLNQLI